MCSLFGRNLFVTCVALFSSCDGAIFSQHSIGTRSRHSSLAPVPLLGRWDWSSCRIVPPLVEGDDKLIVFTSVFVGRHCASVTDSDVIPSTHLTPDRLPSLLRLVRTWTTPRRDRLHRSGCVSVSFGAEDPDALLTLRETLAGAAELAERMVVHVVIGSQSPYPFNVHRNTAMEPWNSAALFASRPFSWIRYADELNGSPRAPAAGLPQRPGAHGPGLEALDKSLRGSFFNTAQTRVRYPFGLWLDDEGPPHPSLQRGTGGPGDSCVVPEGSMSPLPRDFSTVDADFVAAAASSKRHIGGRELLGAIPDLSASDPGPAVNIDSPPLPDVVASANNQPGISIDSVHSTTRGTRRLLENPRPWMFVIDVDVLPSGNADEFAEAVTAGNRSSTADSISAAHSSTSADVVPCLDRTSPVFVVAPFAPVSLGPNSKTAAKEVVADFLSSELRNATAPNHMKQWLNAELARGYATIFGDPTRCLYQGAIDLPAWLRFGAPASSPLRYTPFFEPFFIARAPLPPFDEFFRGRGNDKSSWFVTSVSCKRFSLHLLGDVFVVSDSHRHSDVKSADGVRDDRPCNRQHMQLFLQRLNAKVSCQPHSGDCYFSQHANPAMSGRSRGRKPSIGSEDVSKSANDALKSWPKRHDKSDTHVASPIAPSVHVIMSDNRALSLEHPSNTADAPAISAVINFKYAQRHGYGFTFFVMEWDGDTAERLGLVESHKEAGLPACYHASSQAFRHASWSKILACWTASSASTSIDDSRWAVYLDSDCVVSNHSTSVDAFVAEQRTHSMVSGPPIDSAVAAFANDLPYKRGMPNAGTFLFRPGPAASAFFTHWWNAPDLGFGLKRTWEQKSLSTWFNTSEWVTRVTVMDTAPFMDFSYTGDMWLRHYIGSFNPARRMKRLRADLQTLGIDEAEFASLLREVIEKHTVRINVLEADARVSGPSAAPRP